MDTQKLVTVDEFIKCLKEREDITITKRTLRYYALEGLLHRPAKFGGNKARYLIDQIPKLKTIILLKSFGKSIKEIKELMNKDTPITEETFMKIENNIVERIAQSLTGEIIKLITLETAHRKHRERLLAKAVNRIDDYESRAGDAAKYASFIIKITGHLKDYLCVIPSDWDIAKFTGLLGANFTPNRGIGLDFVRKDEKPLRSANYHIDNQKMEEVKNRTKKRIKALIENHLEEMRKEVDALEKID